jgi:hypothetical protein
MPFRANASILDGKLAAKATEIGTGRAIQL